MRHVKVDVINNKIKNTVMCRYIPLYAVIKRECDNEMKTTVKKKLDLRKKF